MVNINNIEELNLSGDEESSRRKDNKYKRKDSENNTDIRDILPENTLEVEKNLVASALKNNYPEKIKTGTVEVEKNLIASAVKNDHPEKIKTGTLEVEKNLVASALKNYHPEKIKTAIVEVEKNLIASAVKNYHPEKIETGTIEAEKNLIALVVKNDHPEKIETGTLDVENNITASAMKNDLEKIKTGTFEVEKNLIAVHVKNDHPEKIETGTIEAEKNLIALVMKNDHPEKNKTGTLEVENNLTASAMKNDLEKIITGSFEVKKNLIAMHIQNNHPEKIETGTIEVEKNLIASAVKNDHPEKNYTGTLEIEKNFLASAVKNDHPEKIKTSTLEVEKNLIALHVKNDHPEKIQIGTVEVEKNLIASAIKNDHPEKIESSTLEVEKNLIALAVKNDHPKKIETGDEGSSGMKRKEYETRKIIRKESERSTDVKFNLPENTLEVDKNLIASVVQNKLEENTGSGEERSSGNIFKTRGRKRKRKDSDNSTDIEDIPPEKTLKVEKNLIVKNNLEEKNESDNEGSSGVKGNKYKTRGRKRKRKDSESSTDIEDILPENTLEVEKNLIASAAKNNLDDESVKKILKKVVTNEHVFALVKLREEEDEASGDKEVGLQPKFTRARMKELMKVSPNTTAWNIELTPIKHIPVKTRPEVKALIAQELPEDEDDEEYKPTPDDVPSDDDHTLESCSDIDSQPRTPATPSSIRSCSPRARQDGPFKLPQELRTPVRKRLKLDEEPTIALRTRSKLSLSATPIEHIESSFVPPDDIPAPDIEDPVWNEFLNDILDPTSVSRVEDDDEADPEYNVAADPDAEEDELENTIVNISKKELNDLLTEIMDIMPETTDNLLNEELLVETGKSVVVWEGKREPESDEDTERSAERITLERRDSVTRLSVGKTEPEDPSYQDSIVNLQKQIAVQEKENIDEINTLNRKSARNTPKKLIATKTPVKVHVEERIRNLPLPPRKVQAPAAVRSVQKSQSEANVLQIEIDSNVTILPEQIQILQQQLRQHIQLCTSNFLQLFVNPVHWKLAPCYKEYLMQLHSIVKSNPNSVVDVCNLKPAAELVDVWEKTASEDTPENKEMVEFVQNQAERNRRRYKQNSLYAGEFPEMVQRVIANSPVFLYPYLLPAMPYRADRVKKFGYRMCEDNLIALGLDMFWQYVESNPEIYPLRRHHPRARMGLQATCELMCKYMFPWLRPRLLILHLQRVRKEKDNPIHHFFKNRHIEPVSHKLLPYNPNITLYEQPEHEVPRIWVRYLATSSKRFRDHLYKRKSSGLPPVEGVSVELGKSLEVPKKNPLPIEFTKEIVCTRKNLLPKSHKESIDKFDINLQTNVTNNFVNNATENILVMDSEDGRGKVMVLENLLPKSHKESIDKFDINLQTNVTNNLVNNVTGNILVMDSEDGKGKVMVLENLLPKSHKESIDKFDINLQTNVTNNLVNNVTENILVMDSEDGKSKVMVLGSLLPVSKVTPSPRKSIDIALTNNLAPFVIQNNTNNEVPDADVNATQSNAEFSVVSEVNDSETEKFAEDNQVITNNTVNNELTSQVYRLIETSTGRLLVPMNVKTNTVNSINRPISTAKENINIRKDTSCAGTKTIENKNHCRCCILLKKICKGKQTTIKDFFKPSNNEQKPCECTNKKYPKISKRLQMLLENYKMNSWGVFGELTNRIKAAYSEKENNEREDKTKTDDAYDLDDIAAVLRYQMKVTVLTNNYRNYYTKTRVYNLFKNYHDVVNDPLYLAEEIYKICDVDLIELYKEFLGFLTVEQAVRINMFKDYFLQRCVKDIIKKVEQEVADKNVRHTILSQLDTVIRKMYLTSCGMCCSLLHTMDGLPKLARYVFSLFPHRTVEMKEDGDSLQDDIKRRQTEMHLFTTTQTNQQQNDPITSKELNIIQQLSDPETTRKINTQQQVNSETNFGVNIEQQMSTESTQSTDEVNLKDNRQLARELEQELDQAEDALSICDEPHNMEYEADHSSCGEDDDNDIDKRSVVEQSELGYTTTLDHIYIKFESLPDEVPDSDTKPLTVDNNEAVDSDSTDKSNSMTIVEEEAIKAEAPEWKREEDKLILEVLKQHLTPQDRKDKTILDIMEEKNLYQMLEESLTTKSLADIQDRVIYLLEILVRMTKEIS